MFLQSNLMLNNQNTSDQSISRDKNKGRVKFTFLREDFISGVFIRILCMEMASSFILRVKSLMKGLLSMISSMGLANCTMTILFSSRLSTLETLTNLRSLKKSNLFIKSITWSVQFRNKKRSVTGNSTKEKWIMIWKMAKEFWCLKMDKSMKGNSKTIWSAERVCSMDRMEKYREDGRTISWWKFTDDLLEKKSRRKTVN